MNKNLPATTDKGVMVHKKQPPTTTKAITNRTTTINIKSPKAVADFANELKRFIVTQKLYSDVKGKNFVNVEGWQFAGASMGIYPIVEKLEDISVIEGSQREIKYRAEVKLVQMETEKVVGYGVAICSNKESAKKSFDEYAIASMAQTRATGKAFRNTLGWLMKLAGYEATPAEEAEATGQTPSEPEIVEVPIETMRVQVDDRLSSLQTHERMRVLKTVGKLTQKDLDDGQYRRLWYELGLNEVQEAE